MRGAYDGGLAPAGAPRRVTYRSLSRALVAPLAALGAASCGSEQADPTPAPTATARIVEEVVWHPEELPALFAQGVD